MTPEQADIRDSVTLFLHLINSHLETKDRHRKGGWLCILRPDGEVFIHQRIGKTSSEKDERYKHLSAEKALRLHAHPGHRTSWQSRDPALDRWGGAIRTIDGWVFSFSGLPEAWDEALMIGIVGFIDVEVDEHRSELASPDAREHVETILQIDSQVDD